MTEQGPVFNILSAAVQNRASDVHLKLETPPVLRIDGVLRAMNTPPLDVDHMNDVARALCAAAWLSEPTEGQKQLDFSLHIQGTGRFRCHLYRQRGAWSAAIRVIPEKVPTPKALRLPPVVKQIIEFDRGIVLVSGATGMGKSSTIASILAEMSQKRNLHILTIEDPIEFAIPQGLSIVSQRGIGPDVNSFDEALHASFREDPDVLFIGELRSPNAVDVALQAGESGHLCLSTIHTADATSTVQRIATMVPDDQRRNVLTRMAESLKAIISQRLIPMEGRPGRILATEVMVSSPSIKQAIRDPDKHKTITQLIAREATGTNNQSFDQHLITLVRNKLISEKTAESAASSPSDLLRSLRLA